MYLAIELAIFSEDTTITSPSIYDSITVINGARVAILSSVYTREVVIVDGEIRVDEEGVLVVTETLPVVMIDLRHLILLLLTALLTLVVSAGEE